MRVIPLDTEEESRELLKDERVKRFLNTFVGHNRELYLHHVRPHILGVGIILPTKGKNVNLGNQEG
jgi:hypothetical protein